MVLDSFYSTYEELKQRIARELKKLQDSFLQYLWGIETQGELFQAPPVFKFLQYLWGIETTLSILYNLPVVAFLQYLWGIETRYVLPQSHFQDQCFYSTYEELKLKNFDFPYLIILVFLQYLWGIETCTRKHSRCIHSAFLQYLWGIETKR